MIARKNRFHGYGGLKHVYRNGRVIRGPLFFLRAAQNPKRYEYRLAVVVSKKVHKSAVVRNRIRRRMYELFRQNSDLIQQPYDIVCTVFSDDAAAIDAKELEASLRKQLSQLK